MMGAAILLYVYYTLDSKCYNTWLLNPHDIPVKEVVLSSVADEKMEALRIYTAS